MGRQRHTEACRLVTLEASVQGPEAPRYTWNSRWGSEATEERPGHQRKPLGSLETQHLKVQYSPDCKGKALCNEGCWSLRWPILLVFHQPNVPPDTINRFKYTCTHVYSCTHMCEPAGNVYTCSHTVLALLKPSTPSLL